MRSFWGSNSILDALHYRTHLKKCSSLAYGRIRTVPSPSNPGSKVPGRYSTWYILAYTGVQLRTINWYPEYVEATHVLYVLLFKESKIGFEGDDQSSNRDEDTEQGEVSHTLLGKCVLQASFC